MYSIVAGKTMESRLQELKAPSPIHLSFGGKLVLSFKQPSKASLLIFVTDSGITVCSSSIHEQQNLSGISVSPSGKTTLFNLLLEPNASNPIFL